MQGLSTLTFLVIASTYDLLREDYSTLNSYAFWFFSSLSLSLEWTSFAQGSVFVSINVASAFVFLALFVAFLLDPNDICFFLLFGIILVCLLKLPFSIIVRCNLLCKLLSKALWQKVYYLSTRKLQRKFSIEIYNIVSKAIHLLINTPGFLFPRFWKELFPLSLLLLLLYCLYLQIFLCRVYHFWIKFLHFVWLLLF